MPVPRVHVEVAADARVENAEQAATLIRVAQEGLTNAARHAGSQNVWIRLVRAGGYCELVVEDDGRSAAPIRPGSGITGMRERVRELGGELEVTQVATGGLRIRARLPDAGASGMSA
jgi:signal transduction histidine kinase